MGNTLASIHTLNAGDRDRLSAAAQLLKRHHNGDTCLIRAVRASSNGSCARRRIQTACETLRGLWERDPVLGKRSLSLSSPRRGAQQAPTPEALLNQLVNAQNDKGESALAVAALLGHVEAVEHLLELGANPWLADRHGGRMAIHVACLNAKAACVSVLLNRLPAQWRFNPSSLSQRYIEANTISGFTPLHCAVASNDIPTIRAVLACHPRVNATSRFESYEFGLEYPVGSTALHIAAAKGNRPAVAILLRYFHNQSQERTDTTLMDPRCVRNSQHQLPWQVAYDVHILSLAEVLHPSLPLSMFFAEVQPEAVPSLRSLAAAALKQHLLRALDQAEAAQSTDSGPSSSQGVAIVPCSLPSDDCPLSSSPPTCFSRSMTAKTCGSPPSESELSRGSFKHHAQPPARCCDEHGMCSCDCMEPVAGLSKGSASGIHAQLVSRLSMSLALAGEQEADAADDTCDVCMDADNGVKLEPCGHKLCVGCARHMVKAMKERAVTCPFCRRGVGNVAALKA